MTDTVGRVFNLPILTDVIVSGVFAGLLWWKFYHFDIKGEITKANTQVDKAREKVFGDAQKDLKKAIEEKNVPQVIVNTSKSYVAANSFGPAYTAGKFIENQLKSIFKF